LVLLSCYTLIVVGRPPKMSAYTTKDLPRWHRSSGAAIVKANEGLNAYRITLTPKEAAIFLFRSAVEYDISGCTHEGCEVCTEFVETWWEVYFSMRAEDRAKLDPAIETGELAVPRVPGSF
jgi:hypothetical protein